MEPIRGSGSGFSFNLGNGSERIGMSVTLQVKIARYFPRRKEEAQSRDTLLPGFFILNRELSVWKEIYSC